MMCFPALGVNTEGCWEVTDVKVDKEICESYKERFRQTFLAKVCGTCTLFYDVLTKSLCCD